jgi:hypothetical protein
MSPLEQRYRLLLAAYPPRYRRLYGEEMVGVLMDSARPDQRRPSLRDAGILLRQGISARLRPASGEPAPTGRFGPQWTSAAAVALLLGTALLTVRHAYWLVATGQYATTAAQWWDRIPLDHTLLTLGWGLALLAVLTRQPGPAAALTTIAAAGELVAIGHRSAWSWPQDADQLGCTSVLLMLCCALIARRTPLRRQWSQLALLAATAAFAASGLSRLVSGTYFELNSFWVPLWTARAAVLVLLTSGWVLLGQPAPVRRRLFVLAVPVPLQLLANVGFWDAHAWPGPNRDLLPALTAVGPLSLAVGVLLLHRLERLHHRAEPGRAASTE